ncbi:hypothetical protein GCM10023322_00180 [Rugosimonospora acidiphila]|uniref:Sortase A n=1 Tax=Rugosimonospora acidiphila TaxID=556531 RepID=A0ABP9RH50_9ACTN
MAHTPKHRVPDSDATIEIDPMDAMTAMSEVEDPPLGGSGVIPRPPLPAQPGPAEFGDPGPGRIARTVRAVARAGGEVLITFGLVVLLFVGYQLYGRVGEIKDHQRDLDRNLSQSWSGPGKPAGAAPAPVPTAAAPEPEPADGEAIGRLYIPKLDLDWVMVEGVSLDDLSGAPGHYPGTAMPGQVGNFAAAGHRERGMFWDLDQVQPGDYVVMETQTSWYVYKIFENHIVTPHSVEVIAPTPNEPGVPAKQADITLTTCNPKWDNYQRLVVHGTLVETDPHDKRPSQLES